MKKANRINITVGRYGSEPEKVEVPEDSTVAEALANAGITLGSVEKAWVNGERASLNDILEDKDNINLVSPKEGGSN